MSLVELAKVTADGGGATDMPRTDLVRAFIFLVGDFCRDCDSEVTLLLL